MAGTAPQIHEMTTDEARNIAVDMTALLRGSETLTGSPTIQAADGVLIDNKQVNTAPIEINNTLVEIGKAVLFRASEATKGQYVIDVLCSTSDSQTIEGSIRLNVARSNR